MKSYLMVITAMLIWGSSGVFRRYIPVPSDFLAFLRGVLGSLFMLCLILYYKKTGMNRIPAKTVGMLLLAGAMYGFNWIFFFEAINYTTVPIATLCYYMQPALVILLSPLFLQEKLTRGKIVVLCLTTTGMVLVSGITETESVDVNQLKGVIFGLSAGLLFCPKIETGVGFRPSVADGTGRSYTIPDEKHNRFYVPFIYVYIRFT